MEKNTLYGFLKDEYLHIQSIIEDFDNRVLTIKAWSISFSFGALATAFVSKAPIVLIIASISSLVFWVLETQWKTFQYSFYKRSKQIEEFFRDVEQHKQLDPLQISTSWSKEWKNGGRSRFFRIFLWPHVAIPHVLVLVVGVLLYLMVNHDIIEI